MNRLKNETSSYLRQHATNPVEWYAWTPEALKKSKKDDKPILVSIGYSTCHWCHVMERESFEDKDVANFMNEHFINIKVDREELPDLDAMYMDACQIIAGTSGWPLNVFLTPDLKPFFAGTYFPPEEGHKKMSWFQALQYALYNFMQNRSAVEAQADRVLLRMENNEKAFDASLDILPKKAELFSTSNTRKMYNSLQQKFDKKEGGFGQGQKFPNIMALEFLLNYYTINEDEEAFKHLRFSLHKMLRSGLYDHVGGGIARYAIDREWRVPHFEKMLYDNALFIQLLAKTYRLTGRRKYKTAFEHTVNFLEREMMHVNGGFYSALDADSGGKEGEYYTWNKSEIEQILGDDSQLFCEFFDVTENGNWEGTNIPHQPIDSFSFADENNIDREDFRNKIIEIKEQLLVARQKRKPPHRDEKIILGWNALMISAFVEMYMATNEERYFKSAKFHLSFLLKKFVKEDGVSLSRIYAEGKTFHQPVLKDYVFLVRALLDIYYVEFDAKYLKRAESLTFHIFEKYKSKESILFNFSKIDKADIIYERKDFQDDEMPSGNAMMTRNLQDLGILLGKENWREHATKVLVAMHTKLLENPLAFSAWANTHLAETAGVAEIAVIGDKALEMVAEFQQAYIPFRVIMATSDADQSFPLFFGKEKTETTLIYVCKDYACQRPIAEVKEFEEKFTKRHILKTAVEKK